jgi:hydroxymethylpyrimidine pyrophosphatase-like HAD family hydrolase
VDVRRAPLRVANLHNPLAELARFLVSTLEQDAWFDSFLLAAGMNQLVDDHIEPDPLSLGRASSYLAKSAGAPGRAVAVALTRPAGGLLVRASALRPSRDAVPRLAAVIERSLEGLADLATGNEPPPDVADALLDLTRTSQLLAARSIDLPDRLLAKIVRLPACFRSFDQHPDDLRSLAREIARGDDERDAPQLVVGIRTSGSYLAPLLAASLRAEGYSQVATLTMRPGRRPSAVHRLLVRASNARDGRVIVCDDPPGTGSAIASAVAQLSGLGVAPERIVLALALFPGVERLPDQLSGLRAVLLPYEKWTINERIAPEAVRAAATELLGEDVSDAEQLSQRLPGNGRGHVRAAYALAVRDERTQSTERLTVAVESVGLGYFGTHALAIAEQLGDFLPSVLGVRDGLLYRVWLPEEANAEALLPLARDAVAGRIAAYAFARNQRLRLDEDFTLRQSGQYPAWEAASTALSRAFGRGWPAGRTLTTDRAVKQLLRVRDPSVIDGRVELRHWFARDGSGTLVKVDWDQGDSWNLGLTCCDPVFDLAGVTAARNDPLLARELREAYQSLAAEPVDEERWLLYELAHLSAPGAPADARHELDRARSRALQRYFHSVYFEDLAPARSGPLCGIDLDGVLETQHLGFPALTPASASALRALIAHGFRPLLVTGRSLSEVIERCSAYGLAGGVAEYGCVTFDAASDHVEVLIDTESRLALERLCVELRAHEAISLDEDYNYAIRAFVRGARGRRGPLPDELLAEARRSAEAEDISLIVGDAQTDIVDAATDKGRGVVALAAALGAPEPPARPLAFAVGDTKTDLPLVALAERAFAPAHAAAALGGSCKVTRSPYQRGFAEAVAALIDHDPGSCPDCAIAPPSTRRRQLLALLAIAERGISRLPIEMTRFALLRSD